MNALSSDERERKMGVPLHVLIVEDSKNDYLLLMEELRSGGYDPVCERVETGEAMSAALDREPWDAVLIDYALPHFSGIAALELIKRKHIDLPAIIVSGTIDDVTAVAAMKAGAHDFIAKNNLARLIPAIEREMHEAKGRQERRRIREALAETEKKFFAIFQHSPVSMAISSIEEGRLWDVNEQYTRLVGFSRDELIGHTTTELNLWADPEERKRYVQSIGQSDERIQHHPASVRTKSGNVIKVLFSADVIKLNAAPYLLSSAVDITERMKTEDILKTQAHILDRMAEGVNLADENGFITFTNPTYDAIFGYGRGELIGQHVSILNAGSSAENIRLSNEIIQMLKTSGGWSGELTNRKKDGTLFTTRANISAMDVSGKQFWVSVQEDITERKKMDEALRAAEENFRHSLDDSALGVRIATAEGETLYANRAVLDIFGYDSFEELRTVPLKKLYTPESHAEAQIRKRKRKQGDAIPSKYEVSIVRKNGEVRQLQVFRKLTLWGGEQQFQVIYQDITEHKRAEEALRESEERYRSLFENSMDAVLLTTPDGKIIKANPAACRMFGYTEEEFTRIGRADVVDTEDPRLTAALEERARTGMFKGELTCLRRDKTWFPVDLSSIVFKDHQGDVRTSMFIRDLSESKLAEEALRESNARYRQIVETASEGIWQIDNAYRTTFVNEAMANMLGYPHAEMLGRPVTDFIFEEDLLTHQSHVEKISAGIRGQYERRFRCKDGTTCWVLISATPIQGETGQFAGSFGMFTDIGRRKQVEDVLRRSREQLRALAGRLQAAREEERTKIAREIHDEMGGALTALKIDISLLARTAAKVRDKALTDSLKARMNEMMKLIDATMRNVRSIATGLRPGVLDDLGLTAALEWQLTDFQKRTGIHCEFTSSSPSIDLDEIRGTALFRIAQEALTNVARHARATEVHLRLQETEHGILLEVKDNGTGIRENEIQGSNSLGILGMRERALSFGGRVTVTGRPGEGTTVTVESPPAEKREQDREVMDDQGNYR